MGEGEGWVPREAEEKARRSKAQKFNDREEAGWLRTRCAHAHTSLACVIGRGLMMCRISSFHRPFFTSRPGLSAFSRHKISFFGALSALSHLGEDVSFHSSAYYYVGVPDSLLGPFLRAKLHVNI